MTSDARQEIVDLCTLMINNDIDLIAGCRKLTSLCEQVDEGENEIFFPIVAIESETDHFPIGTMRENCSENFLNKADKEMAEYLREVSPDIISYCKEIINYFQRE